MMMPSSPMCVMNLPSYWFRIRESGRIGKAYIPHWDGVHFKLEKHLRWFTLDELEPISEDEYNQELSKIKNHADPEPSLE